MFARLVLAACFTLACLVAAFGSAAAASVRPNGLDHRVDALSQAQLMTQPASALADPDRQTAAQRLVRWMLPGWLASVIVPILTLAYFWQSGAAARVRDWLRQRTRSETATRLAFGAILGLLVQLADAIPEFYLYRVQRVMGLSLELYRFWSIGWLLTTAFAMVLAGVTVAIVLWLVERTHQWYVYTMLVIVAASLLIAVARPLAATPFQRYTLLPAALATRAAALENRAGVSVPVIFAVRRDNSALGSAGVLGLGPTMRVVISDTLVAAASPGEIDYAIGQQLGHVEDGDPMRNALWTAGFIILGAALAVFVSDRVGFRRDDDALSRLALVAAFMGCVYIVIAPVDNAMLQAETARADTFALRLTGDRSDAVRAVVRMVDQRMDEICPSLGNRLFLARMPSAAERISAFNGSRNPCP